MTRMLDIRLQSSGAVTDAIRRLEYLALLLMSAAIIMYPGVSAVFAFPLVFIALMLVPTGTRTLVSRERQCMDVLNGIQNEGFELRTRWLVLSQTSLAEQTAMERWYVQRDIVTWVDRSRARMKPFPGLRAILEAHEPRADLVDDLDSRLGTISRLRRMVSLSERLNLPI